MGLRVILHALACALFLAAAASAQEPTRWIGDDIILSGTEVLSRCSAEAPDCVRLDRLRDEYLARRTSPDTELNIFADGSPWTLLGAQFRFVTPEQFAARIRSTEAWRTQAPYQTVRLLSSWSSVRMAGKPALAERLAAALGLERVEGVDGFLWMKSDGTLRTTRQALTVFHTRLLVRRGDDIMLGAHLAFTPDMEAAATTPENRAQVLFRAGLSAEVFGMDRPTALAKFQAAADSGHVIAAYNAAQILLDRNGDGDRTAAIALLRAAAEKGDRESADQLRALN